MKAQDLELGPQKPAQMSRWLIIALVVAAACVNGLVLYSVIWPRAITPYIARLDYGAVAKAFFRALLNNDYPTAASLTLVDQGPRIETWMAMRQTFTCPFRFTFDEMEGEVMGAVGGRVEGSPEASYHWSYACTHEDYYFAVDDIELLLGTDGHWTVVSWKVCEKRKGLTEICDE